MQWMGLEARYGSQRAEQESISIHMQIANNVSAPKAAFTHRVLNVSLHRDLKSISMQNADVSAQRVEEWLYSHTSH